MKRSLAFVLTLGVLAVALPADPVGAAVSLYGGHGSDTFLPRPEKGVMMAGFFGTTELSLRACFRRSKAALRGQNFVQKLAQAFEGGQSVAVGEIGERTEAAIKCAKGAGKGSTFFAIDVASTIQGEAAAFAEKLHKALLPPPDPAGIRPGLSTSYGKAD